jgi:hypothetical protein
MKLKCKCHPDCAFHWWTKTSLIKQDKFFDTAHLSAGGTNRAKNVMFAISNKRKQEMLERRTFRVYSK